MTTPTHFEPSPWHLQRQLAEADRKFEAHRARALAEQAADRFEAAGAFNRRVMRADHEIRLIQGARQRGYKA